MNNNDRWCPECNSELHYRELIGGGTHIYCMVCDYEKWEDKMKKYKEVGVASELEGETLSRYVEYMTRRL